MAVTSCECRANKDSCELRVERQSKVNKGSDELRVHGSDELRVANYELNYEQTEITKEGHRSFECRVSSVELKAKVIEAVSSYEVRGNRGSFE